MLLFTDCRDNCKDELYTGAYTSYRSLDQYILIILMNFRKCLGSIRTFNAPRTQRHKESRTVVLRFLKIITPVKCVIPHYDGHISCPMEGELYQRHPAGPKARQKVWSVNIDKSVGPESARLGLKLLWDA